MNKLQILLSISLIMLIVCSCATTPMATTNTQPNCEPYARLEFGPKKLDHENDAQAQYIRDCKKMLSTIKKVKVADKISGSIGICLSTDTELGQIIEKHMMMPKECPNYSRKLMFITEIRKTGYQYFIHALEKLSIADSVVIFDNCNNMEEVKRTALDYNISYIFSLDKPYEGINLASTAGKTAFNYQLDFFNAPENKKENAISQMAQWVVDKLHMPNEIISRSTCNETAEVGEIDDEHVYDIATSKGTIVVKHGRCNIREIIKRKIQAICNDKNIYLTGGSKPVGESDYTSDSEKIVGREFHMNFTCKH